MVDGIIPWACSWPLLSSRGPLSSFHEGICSKKGLQLLVSTARQTVRKLESVKELDENQN
jgi:hypothetical protein